MLIVDLKINKLYHHPESDKDVVVVKGASQDLINSLASITLHAAHEATAAVSGKYPLSARPYVERTTTQVPTSVLAAGEFEKAFNQISSTLNSIAPSVSTPSLSGTFVRETANRRALQASLADVLTSDVGFVERLRTVVQDSSTLNPDAHTVTSRNIQAAIALFCYYGDSRSFTSKEGVELIARQAAISRDTLTRLAIELKVLRIAGASTGTHYFVSRVFGQNLITVLNTAVFGVLLSRADSIQDQIDALGR
jgi:hypothetical protein